MSYDVEKGFISKLLQTKDILSVKDNQIKPAYFSGENKLAYQFIYETVLSTGEVPTVRAFQRKFPRYKLEHVEIEGRQEVGTEENIKYWCDELRLKVKHNTLADMIDGIAGKLQDFDTEEAYSLLKKEIAYIESEVVETSDVDLTKGTEDRKLAYLDRKNNKGMRGIPTGFSHLDYILKGLEKETLTTVIAQTGIGKTWLEVIIGANCQLQNYRVLQLVTEMSEEIMRDRYEAVLFAKCYNSMNYNAFKSGMLSLEEEKKYFEFLENDLPYFEPLILATATGVMGVSASIDKYKPDIVLIDSAYLMEDDQGAKDDWLRVAHITRDLKKLAKRAKIPILINTQADKNTSKKTGPELGSIMYTQAIGQDCLPKDTLVLTDTGYKRIQYLENEVFKVYDGESYKKACCSRTGRKKTIIINYRGNEVKCSPDHKIYIYDNEVAKFVWKKAKDIEPFNDYLLEQNFITEEGHTHVLKYVPRHSNHMGNVLQVPTEASYDLGELIGIFIGDGSIKPLEKGQVTLACGQDEDYALRGIELVQRLLKLEGKIEYVKSSTSGNEQIIVVWYSTQFAEWLNYFINNDFGEKTVKLDYVEMCLPFRQGLLTGLIQSDGSVISQVELTSSEYGVIDGFNKICKSLGVTTRYDFNLNNHKNKHRVRVMTHDLSKMGMRLVGNKSTLLSRLITSKSTGRLNKPDTYIKEVCNLVKPNLNTNSLIYKSVGLGVKNGQLGQKYFEQICDMPYKFMQVEDVVITDEEQEMWDIQVYSNDKRIITNGVVTHNSDNVLALYRDEIMINDREMGIKVLKQREGTLGKAILNWDFDKMNFSEIYMDKPEDGEEEAPPNTLDIL